MRPLWRVHLELCATIAGHPERTNIAFRTGTAGLHSAETEPFES
jgi:hypothetical protein